MPTGQSANKSAIDTGSASTFQREPEAEQGKYWQIQDIRAERPNAYLVRWVDIDPKTGRRYPDEWVGSLSRKHTAQNTRKDCVTLPSVRAWETWKVNNPNKRIRDLSPPDPEGEHTSPIKYRRPSRVVQDSSDKENEPSSSSQPSQPSTPLPSTQTVSVDTFSSSQLTVEDQSPPQGLPHPIIRLPPPPSSAYDYLSLASSSSSREAHFSAHLLSSQTEAGEDFDSNKHSSGRVVPDSQSLVLPANSAIETYRSSIFQSASSEHFGEGEPFQDPLRVLDPIEESNSSPQDQYIASQKQDHSQSLIRQGSPSRKQTPALIAETIHRQNHLPLESDSWVEKSDCAPLASQRSSIAAHSSLSRSPLLRKAPGACHTVDRPLVDEVLPVSSRAKLSKRFELQQVYRSSLLDDIQTQEDPRIVMASQSQSSEEAMPSQGSPSQPLISTSATPLLSFRDRKSRATHDMRSGHVPAITETRPTPPKGSPVPSAAHGTHATLPRSPSPSKLRNQAQSPGRFGNRTVQSISSLKNAHLSLPLHMYRDSLRAYRDQLQWAYQNGLLKQLTNEPEETLPAATAQKAQQLAHTLCGLTLHPDLAVTVQSLTQHPPEQFAKYTRSASSKFGFLESLVTSLKDQDKRIAIFVASGRPTSIVEDYLRGTDVPFSTPAHDVQFQGTNGLRVTLFRSDTYDMQDTSPGTYFDLIIGLDERFSFDDVTITSLEQRALLADRPCLVLRLVVPFSMEHILHGRVPEGLEQKSLKSAFELAAQLSFHMGRLPEERTSPTVLGELIAAIVSKTPSNDEVQIPSTEEFPLPLSPALRGESKMAETSDEPASKLKRPAESDLFAETSTKKARSATPVLTSTSKHDITHVTDSTATTSSSGGPRVYASAAEDAPSDKPKEDIRAVVDSLQTVIKSLEVQNKQLVAESDEYKKQVVAMEAIRAGNVKLQDSNTMLKEKNKALEADLAAARALNATSANPDIRQLEELRQKVEQMPRLERRIISTQQDKDYITERYREADNAADDFRRKLSELEPQIEELQKKASGESRLCREAFNSSVTSAAKQAMTKARLETSIMRTSLVRKETENIALREDAERLKERLGAGVATRASVRAASPAPGLGSPAPGSRVGTPVGVGSTSMSRSGSRQGTPQPGSSGMAARSKMNLSATAGHRSHLREHYV